MTKNARKTEQSLNEPPSEVKLKKNRKGRIFSFYKFRLNRTGVARTSPRFREANIKRTLWAWPFSCEGEQKSLCNVPWSFASALKYCLGLTVRESLQGRVRPRRDVESQRLERPPHIKKRTKITRLQLLGNQRVLENMTSNIQGKVKVCSSHQILRYTLLEP